jgi:hypothetical protein
MEGFFISYINLLNIFLMMNIKTVESIFKILYPELKIEIKSFEELSRKQMNESNEWIVDSPSYFVGVFINEYPSQAINISETMSLYTGFEFNVFTE